MLGAGYWTCFAGNVVSVKRGQRFELRGSRQVSRGTCDGFRVAGFETRVHLSETRLDLRRGYNAGCLLHSFAKATECKLGAGFSQSSQRTQRSILNEKALTHFVRGIGFVPKFILGTI